MSRPFDPVSALLTLAALLIAAASTTAQVNRVKPNVDEGVKGPAIECCRCLGGTTTLDLSTISSNNWTVNGNPVAFLTQINSAWNINPGPAQWVSTSASGGNGSAGDFDYRLRFNIPDCAILRTIMLAGSYGGDNDVSIYLDNITPMKLVAQCTGNWCFSTSHQPLQTLTQSILPGPHTLIVRVHNSGGPSGMFINTKLTGTCVGGPNTPEILAYKTQKECEEHEKAACSLQYGAWHRTN